MKCPHIMVLYEVQTRTNTIIFTEFLFVELHRFLVLVGKKQDMRLVHRDKTGYCITCQCTSHNYFCTLKYTHCSTKQHHYNTHKNRKLQTKPTNIAEKETTTTQQRYASISTGSLSDLTCPWLSSHWSYDVSVTLYLPPPPPPQDGSRDGHVKWHCSLSYNYAHEELSVFNLEI